MAPQRKILNIPMRLIRDCKDYKPRLELLAFGVLVKMAKLNGVQTHLTVRSIKKLCGCGTPKAQRLLETVQDMSVGTVAEFERGAFHCWRSSRRGLCFRVATYKDKTVKTSKSKRNPYYTSDYCVKLGIKKYTLRSLVKEFRNKLIESFVKGQARQFDIVKDGKPSCSSKSEAYISDHNLSSACGLSRQNMKRNYIPALVEKQEIKYKKAVFCRADDWRTYVDHRTGEMRHLSYNQWLMRHTNCSLHVFDSENALKIIKSRYSISAEVEDGFKHVIYDHKKRISGEAVARRDKEALELRVEQRRAANAVSDCSDEVKRLWDELHHADLSMDWNDNNLKRKYLRAVEELRRLSRVAHTTERASSLLIRLSMALTDPSIF